MYSRHSMLCVLHSSPECKFTGCYYSAEQVLQNTAAVSIISLEGGDRRDSGYKIS